MNTKSGEISITQRLARAKVEDFNDPQAEAFAERMVETLNSAAMALMISVGHRTKLFDAMAAGGIVEDYPANRRAGGSGRRMFPQGRRLTLLVPSAFLRGDGRRERHNGRTSAR